MYHFSFRNETFGNTLKVSSVLRRHEITAEFTDMKVVVSDTPLVLSPVAPPGGRGPSKGSLALILPTAWVPSAYKAADGHAFRSAPGHRALCSTNTDADKMV